MPTLPEKLIKIGDASKILGVSIRTLRYWEEKGLLIPTKTPGGTRMYRLSEVENFRPNQPVKLLKIGDVASMLGVSVRTLHYWEEKGYLKPNRTPGGTRLYRFEDVKNFDPAKVSVKKIDTNRENTESNTFSRNLASTEPAPSPIDEQQVRSVSGIMEMTDLANPFVAEQTSPSQVDLPTDSDVVLTRTPVNYVQLRGGAISALVLPVLIAFGVWVALTASYILKTDQTIAFATKNLGFGKLGEATNVAEQFNMSAAKVAAGIAPKITSKIDEAWSKNISSTSLVVAKNDSGVLAAVDQAYKLDIGVDATIQGSLSAQNLKLTDASNQLLIGSNLTISGVAQTGSVVAEIPALSGDSIFLFTNQAQTLSNKTISGANNTLSAIPNSALTNSGVTINTFGTLSGGGTVALGGTITLTGSSSGVTSLTAGTGIAVSGSTGDVSITNSGVTGLTGTTNQVVVSGSTGGVTLSLPQSIATTSNVQFGNIGVGTTQTNETVDVNGRIYLYDSSAPVTTTNRLYSVAGVLYWNGSNAVMPTGTNGQTLYNSSGTWTSTSNLYNNGTNIGIGTNNPQQALTVGSNTFQVNSSGNIVKVNNVTTSFPSSQGTANSVLTNDGSGNLSWADVSGSGSIGYWNRSGSVLSPTNSGDSLSITGGATLTGTLNLNNSGTASTAIGNSTGTVTIASGGVSSWTNTSGNMTISTSTSGTLALTSAGALNLTGASASSFSLPVNTAAALKIWDGTNSLLTFDTRTGTSGVSANTITGIAPTIASAAGSEYTTLAVTPPTITLTGGTQVTSAMDSVLIGQPTITDASAVTIDEANTLTIAGAPIPAGSATISRAVGLRVASGAVAGGATNAYGLFVDAPTSGGANYGAVFNTGNVGIGTTSPGSLLQVGGAVRLGISSSTAGSLVFQNASNSNTTTIQSGAPGSSFSLTLPTSSGSNGDCLQTNGAGGVLSFGACTGGAGGGVTSLNGLTGILSIANASGAGATVTIDNAAADGTTKGIATFNSTNFSASGGVINTIQGISSAASPTFTGLNLSGLSSAAGSGLCISAGVVSTCSAGSSAGTLQSSYDNGSTIATTNAKGDIAFTLTAGLGTPSKFSVTNNHVSNTTDVYINNANASGTNTNGILVEQTGAGTLTNGINVTRTAGTLTNGINFSGTFTNLINSTNFTVSNAGAVTAVGVNSGSGLLQGTGGTTLTGTANINATGTSLTNLGNSTGVLTVASGGTSGWTNTSGTLTFSTLSSGAINFSSAMAAGQTTTAAFNIKTTTDLGAADELFQVGDSGADFLTILGNGNVGIGTTNPGSTFNVYGTSTFGLTGGSGTAGTGAIYNVGGAGEGVELNLRDNAGTGMYIEATATNLSGGQGIRFINSARNTTVAGISNTGVIFSNTLTGGATTASIDANGNIIRTPSDINLKTNITPIAGALDKIMQLKGVRYNFIDQKFGAGPQIGFIAQDLEQVVPEVVSSGGAYKSVNYQVLTALLSQGIKELHTNTGAAYKINSSGALEVPYLKVGKLILDPSLDLSGTANANGTLNFEVMNLQSRVTALEQLNGSAGQDSIAALQNDNLQLKSQVAGIATESAALAQRTNSLETSIQQTSSTLTNLQKMISDFVGNEASASGNLNLTPPDVLIASGSATLANLNVTDKISTLKLDATEATVAATFKSLGETYLGNTTVAGTISVDGTLSISNGNTINALPILYLQNSNLATGLDLFAGQITMDKSGEISFKRLKLDTKPDLNSGNSPTIGSATILAGTNSVVINNNQISGKSKVFVTPRAKTGGKVLAVDQITPGVSFQVSTDFVTGTDLGFDWWIVDTN